MIKGLRWGGVLFAALWGGLVNVFLLGVLVVPHRAPFIALNQAAHWITLFNLLIFALAVTLRGSSRLLAWLAPGVVAFAIWYAPAWLPHPRPEAAGTTFTAATYNVNMWGSAEADGTISTIAAVDADIIGLQEVYPALRDRLGSDLRYRYPYQASKQSLALLSRFPILEAELLSGVGWHLRVVLEIDREPVIVYVIHTPLPMHYIEDYTLAGYLQAIRYALFEYDDSHQFAYMAHMAEKVAAETHPVLLLCDCNSTPHSHQYDLLDGGMDEAFGAQGWGLGLSHPAKPFPLLRIDYVWYTSAFTALEARVWPDAGPSDHYPVWARLALRPPANRSGS
jgi:vancomycin resistance protein VanJ